MVKVVTNLKYNRLIGMKKQLKCRILQFERKYIKGLPLKPQIAYIATCLYIIYV